MNKTLFSAFCFVFFLTTTGFSYELVLKDGRIIKGTLITEDADKIILKADTGAFVNFKKENVDLEKTTAANEGKVAATLKGNESKPAKPRKGRTYTNEDLQQLREKYDWSETPQQNQVEETQKDVAGASSEQKFGTRTENEWQTALRSLYKNLQNAKKGFEELHGQCLALGPQGVTTMLEGPGTTTPPQLRLQKQAEIEQRRKDTCKQADEAEAELTRIQGEYDALIQDATNAGVPSGSIDPERFGE